MVRYGTMRSDYLPRAKKVSGVTYNARGRGRLRTSGMRSAVPAGNARTLRNRARKPPAAGGRINVTVPNVTSGLRGTGRRGKSVQEPIYQFRKYLEAMKESSTVAKPKTTHVPGTKQSVSKEVKRPGLSRVVAKSTQTSPDEPSNISQSGEGVRMEEDEPEPLLIEDGLDRRVKLVKTTVATAVKTPKHPAKLYNVSSRNNSRMVKDHRTKHDDNLTPSARLFWKSFS